ncbi:MAG: hypothetical protein ABIR71_04850 [Chthoniobacterales bacterium]
MPNAEPTFYFSLPRLVVRARGGNATPVETNWLETNIVGAAVFGIAFLFAARWLLASLAGWQQLLLLLPLAILLWLGWLAVLYLNALLVRLARALGGLRRTPDDRAQSFLIGLMTTVFAFDLLRSGGWLAFIGGLWVAAVLLNLLAAAVLAFLLRHGSSPA